MPFIENILVFIKNPDNGWLLFGAGFFLIFIAFVLRRINKRTLTITGNNSGIAVNGDVEGNITQTQINTANKDSDTDNPSINSKVLGLAGNISSIFGLILTAAAFYLTYIK